MILDHVGVPSEPAAELVIAGSMLTCKLNCEPLHETSDPSPADIGLVSAYIRVNAVVFDVIDSQFKCKAGMGTFFKNASSEETANAGMLLL